MGGLLILLLALALLSEGFVPPSVQSNRLHKVLVALRVTSNKAVEIQLALGQVFRSDVFLEVYKGGEIIRGVYAVEGKAGDVVFIDVSSNVRRDVEAQLVKYGPEVVHAIRVQTFAKESAQELLHAYKDELIKQSQPSGWPSSPVITESPFAAGAGAAAALDAQPIVESSLNIRPNITTLLDFTKENIDKVLEEVRPYLIADGGNVAVVSIDEKTRSISLILQGACGTCASSTTTMKMGIERVLNENFANLGPIISVDPESSSLLSVAMIEESLSKILPAIKGMGGLVEIRSADGSTGTVKIGYKGPARLRQGIELVLKDVTQVKMVIVEDII